MRMQRSTYGTLRYDTTEATDDAHRVGGWVAVHTKKNVACLHKDISVTSSLCTKRGDDSATTRDTHSQDAMPSRKPFGWEGRHPCNPAAVL